MRLERESGVDLTLNLRDIRKERGSDDRGNIPCRRANGDPVRGRVLGRDGEAVAAAIVKVGGKVRVVAFLREVEQDDMIARRDGLHSVEGLLIGEVAAAAHDAVLEELGAERVSLEDGTVIAFDGQNIDVLEVVDHGTIDATQVRGKAKFGTVG